jgi:Fe-S-cluster containining protein
VADLEDILKKIEPEHGSGVKDFDKAKFEKLKKNKRNNEAEIISLEDDEVLQKSLEFFKTKKFSELLDYLYEDPSRISSNQIRAIKFLAEVKLSFKPKIGSLIKRDNFYDYKKDLIFSETLLDQAKNLSCEDIDFFAYTTELPQLNYSIIKSHLLDFKTVLDEDVLKEYLVKLDQAIIDVKNAFENDSEVNLHFEERVLYLKALIYKELQESDNVKKNINLYLEKSLKLEEQISKLVLIANQEIFAPDEILSNMKILFGETSEINKFISDKSLLTDDTCGAYGCDDCCRYTYPSISLTEFEYIKNWALENNYDLSKAIERSKKIQEEYQKKYSKTFQVEDKKEDQDLNPEDFKFDCPFLEEGRCSIHPARPLLCRVFGSGSSDGQYLKSCNYYLNQYQYMSSPEHERLVYDSGVFTQMLEESDKYLTQSDQPKTGLIPAFLLDFQ